MGFILGGRRANRRRHSHTDERPPPRRIHIGESIIQNQNPDPTASTPLQPARQEPPKPVASFQGTNKPRKREENMGVVSEGDNKTLKKAGKQTDRLTDNRITHHASHIFVCCYSTFNTRPAVGPYRRRLCAAYRRERVQSTAAGRHVPSPRPLGLSSGFRMRPSIVRVCVCTDTTAHAEAEMA